MLSTEWYLGKFIAVRGIKPSELAEKVKPNLSRNAIYNLCSIKEPPTGVKFRSLDYIIPALEELTGEEVRIDDLLKYHRN